MRSYLLTTETVLQEPEYTTLTHKMTEERVTGKVDGIKALEQAIYKILNTESMSIRSILFLMVLS